jgi:hypothetical protein
VKGFSSGLVARSRRTNLLGVQVFEVARHVLREPVGHHALVDGGAHHVLQPAVGMVAELAAVAVE